MITAKISEHPAHVGGFCVDVMEEDDRRGKRPRIIVLREFHLEDRNGNFARAIEFARCEMAKAITANPVVSGAGASPRTTQPTGSGAGSVSSCLK